MDGNFTADHMKMRHAEEDVPLTSGMIDDDNDEA